MYRAFIIAIALTSVPAIAEAQVRDRPARRSQALFGGGQASDPNRVGQELTLSTSFLGAYDDILAPPLGAPGQETEPMRVSGQSALLDANLRYFVGKTGRTLDLGGRGFATTFTGGRPLVGGEGSAAANFTVRRRNFFTLGMTAQNAPFSSLGEFGQLVGAFQQSELPDADPTLALADLRSWNYGSVASVRRQLNARQSLQVGYDYARTDYESDTGYDTRAHSLTSDYSWQLRRNAALTANYRFGQTRFLGDIANSQKTHTIDTGFDYSRRVSATRYIGVSGAIGASYTDEEQRVSDPETARGQWSPSGRAGFRIDLARSWALNAHYSRSAAVFNRISTQLFYTDSLFVSAGGQFGSRVDSVWSAGVSAGEMSIAEGAVGNFDSYTASYQLRWALARCCATVASYSYYSYRLEGVTLPSGLPQRSGTSGFRVGMSIWLPLYGAARVPAGGSGN